MSDLTGTITQILTYPVKSCAAVRHDAAIMTPAGLQFDRQWLIVDADGHFQTQRQIPHLVWIEPEVRDKQLVLSAPTVTPIELPFATSHAVTRKVTIWGEEVTAWDMGEAAAQWLDNYLQVPHRKFRLVQFPGDGQRHSDPFWCDSQPASVQFADGFAVNVLSEASLSHFNDQLVSYGVEPVDALRFRPNLVIDGLDAHEEDLLHTIEFSGDGRSLVLELVKPCPRCQIPNIDPRTAASEPEVSQALSRYRQLPAMDHAVCFAMNAVVRSSQAMRLHKHDRFDGHWRWDEPGT